MLNTTASIGDPLGAEEGSDLALRASTAQPGLAAVGADASSCTNASAVRRLTQAT